MKRIIPILVLSLLCLAGLNACGSKKSARDYRLTAVSAQSSRSEPMIYVVLTDLDGNPAYRFSANGDYYWLARAVLLTNEITYELNRYFLNRYPQGTASEMTDFLNKYIDCVFDLPLDGQIEDEQVAAIFDQVYQQYKDDGVYFIDKDEFGQRYRFSSRKYGTFISGLHDERLPEWEEAVVFTCIPFPRKTKGVFLK